MANRFPLIANSSANQIQELAITDNLDLTGNSIVGVVSVTTSGGVTIGGTLTCNDITEIDSVGVITAQSLIDAQSNINVTGIITARPGTAVTFVGGVDISNAVETIGTATTIDIGGGRVILSLDAKTGTVFEHDIESNGIVGIVSLTDFPSGEMKTTGTTFSILFTQNSTGTGNTTALTGIGTNITLSPRGATAIASTEAKVGSGVTVKLSATGSDVDIVSFFVRSGSGSTVAYVTNSGNFRFG